MSHPPSPHRGIADRVRELRRNRGMSAQALSERMNAVGVPWDRHIVANLETGRRAAVTVEELLALAYVLEVAPVHLIVPTDGDDEPYRVTPAGVPEVTRSRVRHWVRGFQELPGQDHRRYFSEVPPHEFGIGEPMHLSWPPKSAASA